MANPTQPTISASTADAIAGTLDAATGVTYIPKNVGKNDTPNLHTWLQQQAYQIKKLLGKISQGAVVQLTGLNVGAFSLIYQIGATAYTYAGDATFACTDDATNYLYLDTDQTLKKSTSAWPGTPHVKLAKVVCASGAISSVTDCRLMNFQVGSVENWYDYPAGDDVDVSDESLDDVGGLKMSDAVTAQISSGAVTYAGLFMAIDPESGTEDNLDTITYAGADDGRLVIITPYQATDVVTVRDGIDNINLTNCDCALSSGEFMVLVYRDTAWYELFRTKIAPTVLTVTVDCQGNGLSALGQVNFYGPASKTIAAGAITYADGAVLHSLLNQDSDPTDDLDTISGGADGDLLILQASSAAQVPTIKHNTGNILLANETDYELSDTKRRLVLLYDGTLSKWVEIARSHWSVLDLQGTGNAIAWQPSWYIPETLVLNTTYKTQVYVPQTVVINDFYARVASAPSGGTCVVKILDDDVSIGAATIADGENGAASATLDHTVAAGSILTIATEGINSADELTVSVNGRVAVLAE